MNKSFVLFDKNNNVQKNAMPIVKFSVEGRDYLVYSVEENEQNNQIFVSKIILNSEGKYFIDNLLPDEKGKLSNIVYNLVILLPTESQKGVAFDSLVNMHLDKLSVKLLSDIPNMEIQEYYSNCSIAITNKFLVDSAVKLYTDNLNKVVESVPTWTAPTEVTSPVPASIPVSDVVDSNVKVQESIEVPSLSLQPDVSVNESISSESVSSVNSVSTTPQLTSVVGETVNHQLDNIAVVSDPSLTNLVQQPSVGKIKEAGFANNKYIIIGTVCLLLAVAVVVTAYFLIENMG